jgi:hypothetical protein
MLTNSRMYLIPNATVLKPKSTGSNQAIKPAHKIIILIASWYKIIEATYYRYEIKILQTTATSRRKKPSGK